LNKELLKVLNKEEVEYSNSERKTNQSVQDLQRNLKVFSWDFGKVPIKYSHKPKKVTLTVRNVGGVHAEWAFKLPNDSEIELEPWADPGEPTPEQAFEQHILDNNIFMIEPKMGSLAPGEQTDVNVYYVSKEVDFHHLKVFLQISNGKPLILHFKGETLSRRAHLRL
jgi:cilia- and flagella-associated protein 65